MQDEIARLRDIADRPDDGVPLGPRRQLKLLRKLSDICAPERQVIARRGERKPVAMTVEVAVGLPQILRTMRNKPEVALAAAPSTAAPSAAAARSAAPSTAAATASRSWGTAGPAGIRRRTIRMRREHDHPMVDTWCHRGAPAIDDGGPQRFRVPVAWADAHHESDHTRDADRVPRKCRRAVDARLSCGASRRGLRASGSRSAWSTSAGIRAGSSSSRIPKRVPTDNAGGSATRFAALYLPQSATHPVLPMKTLILPARGLAPDDRLSVRSRTSVHTIQLKEPLDEQAEFIWSPFEILERWLKDEPAST